MNGITVYASNRMEKLLEALAGVLATPLPDPLAPEVIVVQSQGMQRWLSWRLSGMLGVFANARFPFPNALVAEYFDAVVGKPEAADRFTKERMAWRILHLLPGLFESAPFAPLRGYLGGETLGLKGFQLATRIADAFDQYTLYRPDMVLDWDQGADPEDWQAILWRALGVGGEHAHRAAIRRAFLERMRKGPVAVRFPSRISIFGIPSMPRFHFDVFRAIAPCSEIRLFFLNPSREFWGDIVSPKELVRRKVRCRLRKQSPEAEHLSVGHPLLGSLGKLGRDFFNLLCDEDGTNEGEAEFVDPAEPLSTLLTELQADILRLEDAVPPDAGGTPPRFPAGDGSIRIHSVHSPMREMEVLHDQLLDLFERVEGLEPHDIVVMAPDIDRYAPFVSAVFGSIPPSDPRHIPWSMSDRSAGDENETARAFLKVLSLVGSRFGASELLEMIELPAIARRFGFDPDQVERIHRWVAEVRIRWGIDADDRARHGLPPFAENSWSTGFDRLLLGYALKGDGESLFGGTLPHEGIEGGDALLLGRFIGFVRTLAGRVRALELPRTLPEWSSTFLSLLSEFVDESDDAGEAFQAVRKRLVRLGHVADGTGFDGTVPVEVAGQWIRGEFGSERGGRGFLSRGVTFCEMLPMRSIPFRVVALVGMDNGAFPRQDRPPGFDRIADDPRPGDRSLRDEDRYLFLEAVLSARDCFYVSYVGRSIVDNSDIPPSVLVSELIDTLENRYAPPDGAGADIETLLVEKHPLQPFSPTYFEAGETASGRMPFSFSLENRDALEARESFRLRERDSASADPASLVAPFLSAPLPPPSGGGRHVTLHDLKKFFRGPAEYFLKERIRIHFGRDGESSEDFEPFAVDWLDKYLLGEALSGRLLDGGSIDRLEAAVRAGGVLPPGDPGKIAWDAIRVEAEAFAGRVAPLHAEPVCDPVEVDLLLGEFRVTGRIDAIREGGLLFRRCAKVKPKDRIAAWIEHLAWQAQTASPGKSRLAGSDKTVVLGPTAEPRSILSRLLDLYWLGLSAPLPFFPDASFEYHEEVLAGKKPKETIFAAMLRKWPDEAGADPWNGLAFGESGVHLPFDGFDRTAEALFLDLHRHTEGKS
jgi:exodeoxyribonuclease V gamma subunit